MMFEEVGPNSWNGTRVRHGEKYGTVARDINGYAYRLLVIKMDSGETEEIKMYNIAGRGDPETNREWEWFWDKTADKKWYRF
jgi:hypothetical protein